MVTVSGRADVHNFILNLPAQIETKLLRGAARAGATVIRDEAKERSISDEVDAALVIKTKADGSRVTATVSVKPGWARSLAIWQEYGTDPHFISVDNSQREGMSVNRINKQGKYGALVIGGKFVGNTVFHPGAQAHPFLRVSLDLKTGEAVAAAQTYINSRVTPGGIVGSDQPETTEE